MPLEFSLRLPFLSGKRSDDIAQLGDDRQIIVEQYHGRHYLAARKGRMFVATSATGGIALIVAATTGGHPTLWNPHGSGRILSVKKLVLAYGSGTNAPGSLAWNIVERAGANEATGATIPTATRVAVVSAMAGGPVDSKAIWSPTTNTFTAAPGYYRPTNLSLFTGAAATAVPPFTLHEDYDGDLLIAPGTALCLVAQQTTTTSLFRITVLFEEVDE